MRFESPRGRGSELLREIMGGSAFGIGGDVAPAEQGTAQPLIPKIVVLGPEVAFDQAWVLITFSGENLCCHV
jgi:hypothetical protein